MGKIKKGLSAGNQGEPFGFVGRDPLQPSKGQSVNPSSKGKDMTALAHTIADSLPGSALDATAKWIAATLPGIRASLTQAELRKLAQAAIGQKLVSELSQAVDIAAVDYATERQTFLAHAGRSGSEHTRKAYAAALARLEEFANCQGLNILALTAKEADDFIYAQRSEGRSPAAIRLDAAAASSFFTWLERRHAVIRNPFRGSKARPARKSVRKFAIPTEGEVTAITEALSPSDRAAVLCMASRGLRVGALPGLGIGPDGKFHSISKGKEISGILSKEALEAIREAKLDRKRPFAGQTTKAIECRIYRAMEKLQAAGKVTDKYSAHDFRHYFAVTEYRKDRDIHRLCRLLDHGGIGVTEAYLKGLGEIE